MEAIFFSLTVIIEVGNKNKQFLAIICFGVSLVQNSTAHKIFYDSISIILVPCRRNTKNFLASEAFHV
jgi:hypothetical protein